MQMDLSIINGEIVTREGRFVGSIGIRNGRIAAITEAAGDIEAEQTIDAEGLQIIPGAIDAHVHFQDPGDTGREDFEHGTRACAAGGITTAISQPVNNPPTFDAAIYRQTVAGYRGRGYVDYGLHGGGSPQNLERIESLWTDTGAPALKVMMCYSPKSYGMVDDAQLFRIMEMLAVGGGLAYLHAENQALVEMLEDRLRAAGRQDPRAYLESRPAWVETEAVHRALHLAEQTGCRVIFAHVSCAESLEMIAAAKRRGLPVHAESCPHFFTFVDRDIDYHGPYLKFSPVMRDEHNLERMWDLLAQGYVDTIGSDHCPYEKREKEPGETSIWRAPNGVPGLEVLLPVLLDGVARGKVTLERVVEVTSYNPARIYGLYPRKGVLAPGADADLVIVDAGLKKSFERQDIKSKCSYSPYLGRVFTGWPVMTLVRGRLVYRHGEIVGQPGHGRYIARRGADPGI